MNIPENNTVVLKTERKLSWHEQERFNVSKTFDVCANSLSSIVRFSIILVERQQTGYTTPEWQQTVIYKSQNGGVENLGGKYLGSENGVSIWLKWLTYPSEKYEFVNGKEYPVYEMENNPNVGNHQPVILGILHV